MPGVYLNEMPPKANEVLPVDHLAAQSLRALFSELIFFHQ